MYRRKVEEHTGQNFVLKTTKIIYKIIKTLNLKNSDNTLKAGEWIWPNAILESNNEDNNKNNI